MKLRNTFFMLVLSVSMAFLITSCTTEPGGPPPTTGVGIPTVLEVNTLSATSITARWVRASNDSTADTLIVSPQAGGAEMKAVALAGISSATISTLTINTPYLVSVASGGGRTATIIWGTATRSGTLTIFETGDPGNPSGLILGPIARVVSTKGADSSKIDLVLASRADVPNPFISLQTASGAKSGIFFGRKTLVDDYFEVAGGLDKDFYKSGFSTPASDGFSGFGAVTSGNPVVMVVKTTDGNYARIEILPQALNGNKLWKIVGAGPYRAIEVIVSYQPTANAPYAGRPEAVRRGTNEPVRFSRPGGVK